MSNKENIHTEQGVHYNLCKVLWATMEFSHKKSLIEGFLSRLGLCLIGYNNNTVMMSVQKAVSRPPGQNKMLTILLFQGLG